MAHPDMVETMPGHFEPRCMIVEGTTHYWVRTIKDARAIDGVDTPEQTLPGAVRWADERGHAPTHWCGREGFVSPIPTGIVRKSPPSSIPEGGEE